MQYTHNISVNAHTFMHLPIPNTRTSLVRMSRLFNTSNDCATADCVLLSSAMIASDSVFFVFLVGMIGSGESAIHTLLLVVDRSDSLDSSESRRCVLDAYSGSSPPPPPPPSSDKNCQSWLLFLSSWSWSSWPTMAAPSEWWWLSSSLVDVCVCMRETWLRLLPSSGVCMPEVLRNWNTLRAECSMFFAFFFTNEDIPELCPDNALGAATLKRRP